MMAEQSVNQTKSFMVSFDFTKTPVTQIADYIIIAASKNNSSDIHFDPRDDGLMVRFRIDGDCQDYTFVPKAYEKNLITRLKLLANMNITESRLPQDGAIKGQFGDKYLDMRVSVLPLNLGEKLVIRILDYSRSLEGLDTLEFHPKNLEKVKRMLSVPNGIILTTGATGSGKSTTTYSMLQVLNKPETNIITVEDPIEMNMDGINQVQVNAEIGMTFATALRSILRQDPNIILIGEIRDSETAQIAVRASITGHLVLSTIHTNNALSTVERLLDMNVERYLLSTSLSGIISQRLAKMLCQHCHYQRPTTQYEKKVYKKYLGQDVDQIWEANEKGCPHCRNGYHGRIAIHEVLEFDDDVRFALSNEELEKKELAKMVYNEHTITLLQDALIKCLNGKTSFEEVYRNIEIENEDDENYEHHNEDIQKELKEELEKTMTDLKDKIEKSMKDVKDEIEEEIELEKFGENYADYKEAEKQTEKKDNPVVPVSTQPVVTPNPVVQAPAQPVAIPNPVAQTPAQPVATPKPVVQTPAQPVATPNPVAQTPAQPVTAPKPVAPVQPIPEIKPVSTVPTQPVSQVAITPAQPAVQPNGGNTAQPVGPNLPKL